MLTTSEECHSLPSRAAEQLIRPDSRYSGFPVFQLIARRLIRALDGFSVLI
jgi:hypothetical protein